MVAENVYMWTKRKSPFLKKKYPVGFEGVSVFRWTESFLNVLFKIFLGTMFNQLVTIEVQEKFHAV